MKKNLFFIILTALLLFAGCSWFEKEKESNIDSSFALVLISKPVYQNAEEKVYFRFGGSKDGGTVQEDIYQYKYALYEKTGAESEKLISSYPSIGSVGPNSDVYFSNLENGKTYIFKASAYDSIGKKYSKETIYQFTVRYSMVFKVGVVSDENDIYGEKDGIVRNSQTFKVYAKLYNSDSTVSDSMLTSSNVKVKLDLSGFAGATLLESENEKSFVVGATGTTWSLKAPSSKTTGTIKFIVVQTPYYTISNKPVITATETTTPIQCNDPGMASIKSCIPVSDSVIAGENLTVNVVIENQGDGSVIISDYALNFYDKFTLSNISSQWSVINTTESINIAGRSSQQKTLVYKSSSVPANIGPINVIFTAKSKESYSGTSTLLTGSAIEITLSY